MLPLKSILLCQSSTICDGIPPLGCSAFGPRTYEPSLTRTDQCVACPSNNVTIALLIAAVTLVISAAIVYIRAVRRSAKVREWVATTTIFTSHVSIMATVSSLVALRDSFTATVLQALSVPFTDLRALYPQCLLPAEWLTPPADAGYISSERGYVVFAMGEVWASLWVCQSA
jgi:hypothetical protein